ncbi:testis-specific serine/threonine-protein kinase 3-like isoform X1 [Cimex lectularius]|uniref:Protein kinase domain-containing protein n=2 Tax=Cimex lectularius TaxID=79782 RepID=A0A8I6S4P1_CIMLE|nr:testis-specific serine/threonine-protein kinase 3-like isoform X1 [Cimex lectularius]
MVGSTPTAVKRHMPSPTREDRKQSTRPKPPSTPGKQQASKHSTSESYGSKVQISNEELEKLQQKGYTVEKPLSQGCSGRIYLMTYRPPHKKNAPATKMAVKVIDRAMIGEKFLKKFLPREIAILAELNNPHCVQVYSIMEVNMKSFFFMRFAENGDLLDYLTTRGAVDETHARLWIRQLLLALDYLHHKSIAHRDIKCENILVTENLNVKLADFGFARSWVGPDGKDLLSETYCGSLSYAAPEILIGKPYCPKRVDVWSMGVVLFIMFNLAKPFAQTVPASALQAQLARNYRWSPRGVRNASISCKAFVSMMLEPQAQRRPTAADLLTERWMMEDVDIIRLLPHDPTTYKLHPNE